MSEAVLDESPPPAYGQKSSCSSRLIINREVYGRNPPNPLPPVCNRVHSVSATSNTVTGADGDAPSSNTVRTRIPPSAKVSISVASQRQARSPWILGASSEALRSVAGKAGDSIPHVVLPTSLAVQPWWSRGSRFELPASECYDPGQQISVGTHHAFQDVTNGLASATLTQFDGPGTAADWRR